MRLQGSPAEGEEQGALPPSHRMSQASKLPGRLRHKVKVCRKLFK